MKTVRISGIEHYADKAPELLKRCEEDHVKQPTGTLPDAAVLQVRPFSCSSSFSD